MTSIEQTLKNMVSIPSIFPKEQKLANWLYDYLKILTPKVERVPVSDGRDMIISTIGKSKKYICFYGHMDTVPPDPNWKGNPYQVKKQGDRMKGLGVSDMKGGISAILEAAKFAVEKALPMKIAFGVDEENISLGSHILTKHSFFNDVKLIISAENGQGFDDNQPYVVNYGRKGRFVMKVSVYGKTAHAARVDQSINAIFQSSKALSIVESLNFPNHKQLGKLDIIPYAIESNTNSFSIPSEATILYNVLTIPGVSHLDVLRKVRMMFRKNGISAIVNIQPRETPYMEAYEVDTTNPIIKKLYRDIIQPSGVKPGYAISVADENRFAEKLAIPVISIGPVGGGDHTANEWVSLKSLNKTVETYKKILETI